jgi:adenosylmethionine---8-amino-7-oxononanoate aminotransferase
MRHLARLDQQYVWHPFTQMRDWLRQEPIVIVSGQGATLRDVRGREYLDGNASIWTNLHGHNHPRLNAAVRRQLRKIAHSSALGLANEPASLLAQRLVGLANWKQETKGALSIVRTDPLAKVFFSDDGSTALEVALKLAYEFARRTGRSRHPRFLSLEGAYHGDTVGAVSLGHIDLFHRAYAGLLFKSDAVMAPYCYRCRFNRARPERADAREYRQCRMECVDEVERKFALQARRSHPYAALVVEPLIQGAAGMIPQPGGWLRRVAEIARGHRAQLIADEVMTGFGRTGGEIRNPKSDPPPSICGAARIRNNLEIRSRKRPCSPGCRSEPGTRNSELGTLFACQQENVRPDFLCLAKGLTGGYLPMAATLTTRQVFDVFLGEYEEFKTFFHGHSFTANQLGAAAALASLDLLDSQASLRARGRLEQVLREELRSLWSLPNVGDIRQVGLIVGVELVRDWRTRKPFPLRERAGLRVCEALARRGVLTRPIGSIVVLMPPYCTSPSQAKKMVSALRESVEEVFGASVAQAPRLRTPRSSDGRGCPKGG